MMLLTGREKWKLILPESPQRVPAWRWFLAEMAFWGEELPKAGVDYYLRHDTNVRDAIELFEFWHAYPHRESVGVFEPIELAHRIWLGPNKWDTCLMEARLLTGASPLMIGKYTRLLPAVVNAYRKLFFDVGPRLHSESYINEFAIGRLRVGEPTHNLMVALRALGYYAGRHVLDDAIATYSMQIEPQRLRDEALHQTPDYYTEQSMRETVETYMSPAAGCTPGWSFLYFEQFPVGSL